MSQTGSTRSCSELSGRYLLTVWVRVLFSNCTKAPGEKILWLTLGWACCDTRCVTFLTLTKTKLRCVVSNMESFQGYPKCSEK